MTEQTSSVPGWYRDGVGTMRWWDGSAWTSHVAPDGTQPGRTGSQPSTTPATATDVLPGAIRTSTTGWAPSPRKPRRNVPGGLALVAVGAALVAAFLLTLQLSEPHGGIVWIGGALAGGVMILRGIGEMTPEGSSTRRRIHGAAQELADPWAAHHAAKARAKALPTSSRRVPTWVVAVCFGTPVLIAVAFWLVPYVTTPSSTASTVSSATPPRTAAVAATATKPQAKPKPKPAGPYVPNGVEDWTPIGTNAAYTRLGWGPQVCLPGTACAIVKIASRTSCSTLVVHVVFLNSNHVRSSSTTITLRHVRAGHGVRTRLTTRDDFAWDYDVVSARCT